MSTTDPIMGLTIPDSGDDRDTTEAAVNTNFGIIAAHTHEDGDGSQIGTAGISIDADLNVNGYRLTGVKSVRGSSQASTLTGSANTRSAYWVGNDYYVTDGNGNAVGIVVNGSLDTTVSGGWQGDYGASGVDASAVYTDSSKEFELYSDSTVYGTLVAGDVYITEETAGVSAHVRLKSPASLAASYDITFPAAQPGSTSLLSMSSAGALATTRDLSIDSVTTTGDVTVGDDLTVTDAATVGGALGVTGAATLSSTLAVTGATTLSSTLEVIGNTSLGGTLSTDDSATITGDVTATENVIATNDVYHGNREMLLSVHEGTATQMPVVSANVRRSTALTWSYYRGIPLRTGDRIRSISFLFDSNGTATITFKLTRVYVSGGSFTETDVATTTRNTSDASVATVTLSSIDHTLLTANGYFISVSGGNNSDDLGQISITYDRPSA